ncbi:transporter substrate-binding domain-containing protein [Martelella alba]|uniref:Transporter substrate-binding domain-containing protein n=1 Tax=Martelella alba TaxID=2590451 RepID=A0ABY2SH62_9HYPH|nr:transporter substrate-binding domain-containing protein [Martelella alba]TKI04605.1 transporter substrate-binding domain-containing protein [Martelella alba]
MKNSLKTVVAASAILVCVQFPALADTLRVAADLSYPPFQYRDSQGKPAGFEIDITNAVCAAIGAKCQYVAVSFDSEIPALLAKKVDFISPQGATKKRRQVIDFSHFIYHIPTQLVARKGSGLLPDAAKLQGKRIAVQQGTIQEMYANQYWAPHGVEVVPYADQDTIYQDLVAGRLDGALSPAVAVTFGFLAKPEGKDFALVGREVRDSTLFSIGSAYGLRKGDTPLEQRLNQGLDKIMANGTWDKIKQRYFGDIAMKVSGQEDAK